MSRVGKKPVVLPAGVTVTVNEAMVEVKGPKGTLRFDYPGEHVEITVDGEVLSVNAKEQENAQQFRGMARAMIQNMVTGVTAGFAKILEIHGVGYKAQLKGKDLNLSLGFSHPVDIKAEEGITFEVDQKENTITVSGIDNQRVGEVAARIRSLRKPEPYKGKGVRYRGERIIRKAGKSAA